MELSSRDDFTEIFHVCGLDVHNVEALLRALQMPQIYSEVIRTDERFTVAVHAERIDVIRVRVRKHPAVSRGENALPSNYGWNLQRPHVLLVARRRSRQPRIRLGYVRKGPTTIHTPKANSIVSSIYVESAHHLEMFFIHLPKFDCLVVCRQQKVGVIRPLVTPLKRINLLFYLERLEVIKLGFMRLKLREIPVLNWLLSPAKRRPRRVVCVSFRRPPGFHPALVKLRPQLFNRALAMIDPLKQHHASTSISRREFFPIHVKLNRGDDIRVLHLLPRSALSKNLGKVPLQLRLRHLCIHPVVTHADEMTHYQSFTFLFLVVPFRSTARVAFVFRRTVDAIRIEQESAATRRIGSRL